MTDWRFIMSARAAELLSDRQWHDFDEVLQELVKLVPPEQAIRRCEHDRRKHGVNTSTYRVTGLNTPERKIQSGARSIVYDLLRNRHSFEQVGVPPTKGQRGGIKTEQRKIRMARRPLVVSAKPSLMRAAAARAEVTRLGDLLTEAIALLSAAGRKADAERIRAAYYSYDNTQ